VSTDAAPLRPFVHLSPRHGWLNDPNGLVHDGERFHAFFQHHPDSLEWGPMHWGHATSTDLIAWDHQAELALAPGPLGMAFSGSAVVDRHDTAGFGAGAIVLVFTHATESQQVQSLAWSTDGTTFTEADDNPVLVAADGVPDFRDPKVLRWGGVDGHWVMVLAAGDEVRLFTSADLRRWTQTDAHRPSPAHRGALETPDLFPLTADDGTEHWVLSLGALQGAPAGGSGTWAEVGTFDGERFRPSAPGRWVDHGPDFYAAQSWSDVPDGRRIWTAWLNNWDHAIALPARVWRGQLAVPRELRLVRRAGEVLVAQAPVAELTAWHRGGWTRDAVDLGAGAVAVPVAGAALDVEIGGAPTAGAQLVCRRAGGSVHITVDPDAGRLQVACADDQAGDPAGAVSTCEAPFAADPGDRLRVVLDLASVEVFLGTAAVSHLLPTRDARWSVTISAAPASPGAALGPVAVHELAQGNWRHTT
jgi:sucrose-6-phosphate hydrolase SacC (GH32 family)